MALTGWPDGAPLPPPPGVQAGLDGLVAEIAAWSALVGERVDLDWGSLVCGRADLLGLSRHGRRSANGSCRILRARDGWLAINLPRQDDRDAVGALLGQWCDEPWESLERVVPSLESAALIAQGRLLGMPVAPVPPVPPVPPAPARSADARPGWPAPGAHGGWTSHRLGASLAPRSLRRLRVVDCSAMWAGPLAAMILAAGGATVVKVESTARPDAARQTPDFYRWLHPAEQEEVALDLASPAGRRRLADLVDGADVVIESSRPRAFEQLGVGPLQAAPRQGRVWLSITGYGRAAPGGEWVAFGDDAAVAGGLVARDERGDPVFCGDAMADPVTGLVSALAVMRAVAAGGGALLDVAMSQCAASIVATAPSGP